MIISHTVDLKKLRVFDDILKIKILKRLSDICQPYLDFPEEDLEQGRIMEISTTPANVYVEYGGRVHLSFVIDDYRSEGDDDFSFEEGIDFEYIK